MGFAYQILLEKYMEYKIYSNNYLSVNYYISRNIILIK